MDGCITCPWHGYQYRPESGTSPPPFNDQVPTYGVRIVQGMVQVRRTPNPLGTVVAPVPVPDPAVVSDPPAPFYIGYEPRAPTDLARRTRGAVGTVGSVAAVVMVVLALAQDPFAPSRFEYGQPRQLSGRVLAHPYPRLAVASGGRITQYLLAAAGKHGAGSLAAPHDGREVRLIGTLAARGNTALLEVDSILPGGGGDAPLPSQQVLGTFTLRGEIVDSKCWTGVMNPGEGKTHLACAVRCLSGGLPPLLVIRDQSGGERPLLLTDASGGPLPRSVLPRVGRPVEVRGEVRREGELLFLRTDPEAIRVLQR